MKKRSSSSQKEAIREKILEATLSILENEGINNTTVRKIAKLADVNVAAINYYFGSKDKVISESFHNLRNSFEQAYIHLLNTSRPPQERLTAFMGGYCDTIYNFPNLMKAFINHSLNPELEADYQQFVEQKGLTLITNTLGELLPDRDQEYLRMKAFQMMSSLVLISLVGKDIDTSIGLDFSDPATRALYIQSMLPTIKK